MQPQRNGDAADEGGVVLADQDHGRYPLLVMAGLDPAIHVFVSLQSKEDVDHRVKPGDDDWSMTPKRALPLPLIAREQSLHRPRPTGQLPLARRLAHVRHEAVLQPPVVGEF